MKFERITGITPDDFYKKVYEKCVYHYQHDAKKRFCHLIDKELLLSALSQFPQNSIQLIKDGVQGNSYSEDSDFRRAFSDGYSIIVNSAEKFKDEISQLACQVSMDLGVGVEINAYMTPKNSNGLPFHVDSHDAILLQILGNKTWRTARPIKELAIKSSIYDSSQSDIEEIVLKEGSVMYLPRGVPHKAVCGDLESIHLTLTLKPIRGLDIVKECINIISDNNIDLRKTYTKQTDYLSQLMSAAGVDDELLSKALDRLSHKIVCNLPSLKFNKVQKSINEYTKLKINEDMYFKYSNGKLSIPGLGIARNEASSYNLGQPDADIFESMMSLDRFRIRDISKYEYKIVYDLCKDLLILNVLAIECDENQA